RIVQDRLDDLEAVILGVLLHAGLQPVAHARDLVGYLRDRGRFALLVEVLSGGHRAHPRTRIDRCDVGGLEARLRYAGPSDAVQVGLLVDRVRRPAADERRVAGERDDGLVGGVLRRDLRRLLLVERVIVVGVVDRATIDPAIGV